MLNQDEIEFVHIDGLQPETRNSIANALELRLSCPNPSMWCTVKPII